MARGAHPGREHRRTILAGPAGAVGLVGEPTVEFVAAIQGAWLAGRAVSILPGPVRGADAAQWADATLTASPASASRTCLSLGAQLELLRGQRIPGSMSTT